ncbi:alpha/beta fold hydrolase [Cryobacterium sp. Y82]|uniref:alpha/beta fold hydrolase n=1 Tax=Cryobacterium sp. Y82 TaxID=2045017 RepID=UPI0018EB2A58|nr:alpha/beta hydrolase [Cryobacterium sp. Y82]
MAQVTFAIAYGAETVVFTAANGKLDVSEGEPAFTLKAEEGDWDFFLEKLPPPAYQNFFGMLMRVESARVEGDELAFVQHVHIVRRILELARGVASGSPDRAPAAVVDAVADARSGSYIPIALGTGTTTIYVEQAGAGQDVLLLHTAGADSRQFRHLMNDARITDHFRLVAFDLPGHGRSDQLDGVRPGAQALTTDSYIDCIMSVVRSLKLAQPIVVGASMAGAICLELAYRHPDEIGGVVPCEASEKIEGRQVAWAQHPLVNQSLFVPEWVDGLMAPHSPKKYRDEIWWGYSQGGYGTFYGDIFFYSAEWDGRDRVAHIDTARCPVVMLTGEYDYSCTPEMSRATAEKIPGAVFSVMTELGHFPHAENPPRFRDYLLPALAQIVNAPRQLS